jgi:GYF domain 2
MDYYLYSAGVGQTGPFSFDQVRAMRDSGHTTKETAYWTEGNAAWQALEDLFGWPQELAYVGTTPNRGNVFWQKTAFGPLPI